MKSKIAKSFCNNSGFIFDLKYIFNLNEFNLNEKKNYFRL